MFAHNSHQQRFIHLHIFVKPDSTQRRASREVTVLNTLNFRNTTSFASRKRFRCNERKQNARHARCNQVDLWPIVTSTMSAQQLQRLPTCALLRTSLPEMCRDRVASAAVLLLKTLFPLVSSAEYCSVAPSTLSTREPQSPARAPMHVACSIPSRPPSRSSSHTPNEVPITAPAVAEAAVPSSVTAPFVPGGTQRPVVMRRGREADRMPISEAEVSPERIEGVLTVGMR
jgi:hypothetical protein